MLSSARLLQGEPKQRGGHGGRGGAVKQGP